MASAPIAAARTQFPGQPVQKLLVTSSRPADKAMYDAKQASRNSYRLYPAKVG